MILHEVLRSSFLNDLQVIVICQYHFIFLNGNHLPKARMLLLEERMHRVAQV